jgi:8-oxo-dGTP diphosphatase
MQKTVPVFGTRNEALPQKTRTCAYAVIVNSEGSVAAVRENPGQLYLPGGGVELSETLVQAVQREVLEELGCKVTVKECIGHALQYLETDGHCQATYGSFFAAELGEKVQATQEHQLEWIAASDLFHPFQSWAARTHLNTAPEQPAGQVATASSQSNNDTCSEQKSSAGISG